MSEREIMEYDVVVVGAGPAGLAFAIRLKQLKPDISVCVIEKGFDHRRADPFRRGDRAAAAGRAAARLARQPAADLRAGGEGRILWLLDKTRRDASCRRRRRCTTTATSSSRWARCARGWRRRPKRWAWTSSPASPPPTPSIDETARSRGVRIGDMGVAKDGSHKPGYTQGIDIQAPVTVLAEGCRGSLTKQLIKRIQARRGQRSADLSASASRSCGSCRPAACDAGQDHAQLGWPLDTRTYGGSFLYHLDKDRVALGFVAGLDYDDPRIQALGSVPAMEEPPDDQAAAGRRQILSAGARAIVDGGFQSLPKLEMPGALLIGDAAGLLNVPKIKGTHQAIARGMLAAEHLVANELKPRASTRSCALRRDGEGTEEGAQHPPRLPARACGSACSMPRWETVTAGSRRGR